MSRKQGVATTELVLMQDIDDRLEKMHPNTADRVLAWLLQRHRARVVEFEKANSPAAT